MESVELGREATKRPIRLGKIAISPTEGSPPRRGPGAGSPEANPSPAAALGRPIRMADRMPPSRSASLKLGTAFSKGSGNWIPLAGAGGGRFRMGGGAIGQETQAPQDAGGPGAPEEPRPEPTGPELDLSGQDVLDMVSVIDDALAAVGQASLEDRERLCQGMPTEATLSEIRTLRARLSALAQSAGGPAPTMLTMRELFAVQEAAECADRLSAEGRKKTAVALAALGAVALAAAFIL